MQHLKMVLKITVLLLILSAVFMPAHAQEMSGASASNYAGQNGLDINPASIVSAPYKWEIHILSTDVALVNNYMFLKAQSGLIHKSFTGETVSKDQWPDRYTKSPNKFAYASAFVKYPAFIWVDKNYAIAFHVSTRLELSANNVPYHLAKFLKEGFNYTPQQKNDYTANNASVDLLNWHEFGLTFGKPLIDQAGTYLTAAITVNYNYGLNAYYADIKNLHYDSQADTLLQIYNADVNYGHALSESNSVGGALQHKGNGWSANGGVEYYRNRNDNFYNPCSKQQGKPYDYKIGISFMDFGYIKFSKDAKKFNLNNVSTDWYGIDTVKFRSVTYTDYLFSKQFLGHYDLTQNGNSFTMYTPAAVSAQADVPLNEEFYLNLTYVQRISLGPKSIKRSNIWAFTPRYETRGLEFSLPISLFDYFKPRVGAEIRYHWFTVGSDMIGPFFGFTDSYGADIYFAIKFQHFGSCDKGGGGRKKSKIEKCNTPK